MSEALPTVAAMGVRFAGAATAAVIASGGLVYVCAWAALPLSEQELWGVLRLCTITGAAALAALVGSASILLRGLPAVHQRVVDPDANPTLAEAFDAFHGPARAMSVAAATVVVLLVLDAISGGGFSGIVGPRRIAVDVLVFGVFQSGLLYGVQAWRGLLWVWLSRLNPNDVTLPARPILARRYALRVASAFTLLGAAVVSVPLAYLSTAQELIGLSPSRLEPQGGLLFLAGAAATAVLASAMAVFFGWRIGRRIAADVRDLEEHVGSLGGAGHRWSSPVAPELPRARMRTRVADEIARSVGELSEKYAAMAREETRARRAIEDMQRLKSRFMAFMSHDLRSPLNSITGFADILADETDGPLNVEQRKSVQAIRESGQVLVRLVTDIVDTARVEAGRLQLSLEPTAMGELVDEAVTQAREIAPEPGPRFDVVLDPDLPTLRVDRDRMIQALVGVLGHVVRMVPEGSIGIRARIADGPPGPARQVRIEIEAEDLPSEDTQRIFVAFREIKRPSGRRVGGLGLGLALARTLVAAHGGDLYYESEGPKGASFTFALPLDDEGADPFGIDA